MFSKLKLTMTVIVLLFSISRIYASPLIIATEGVYPPFSYFNEAGELTGFDVDIAQALCEVMQRECTIVTIAWSDLLDGLEAGDFDAIIASMAKTEERARRALFSNHYYRSQTTFVGDPRRFISIAPEALESKRLSAGLDSIQATFLNQNYPNSDIVLTDNLDESFELLKLGQVDLVLTDSINSLGFLTSPEGFAFDFIGEPIIDPILVAEARIAVQLGNESLVEEFNQAILQLRLSGAYDRINRKYVPFSIY